MSQPRTHTHAPWLKDLSGYERGRRRLSTSIVGFLLMWGAGALFGNPVFGFIIGLLMLSPLAGSKKHLRTLEAQYMTNLGIKTAAFNPGIVASIPGLGAGQAGTFFGHHFPATKDASQGGSFLAPGIQGGFFGVPLVTGHATRGQLYDMSSLTAAQRRFFEELGRRVYNNTVTDDPLDWDPVIEQGLTPTCPRPLSEDYIPAINTRRLIGNLTGSLLAAAVAAAVLVLIGGGWSWLGWVGFTAIGFIVLGGILLEEALTVGPWSAQVRKFRAVQNHYGMTETTLPLRVPHFDPVAGAWTPLGLEYLANHPDAAFMQLPGAATHADGRPFNPPAGYSLLSLLGQDNTQLEQWGMIPVTNPVARVMGTLLVIDPWVANGQLERASEHLLAEFPYLKTSFCNVTASLAQLGTDNPLRFESVFNSLFNGTAWISSYRDHVATTPVLGAWPFQGR